MRTSGRELTAKPHTMKTLRAFLMASLMGWAEVLPLVAAPALPPTDAVALRLQLLEATPTVDSLRGNALLLGFRLTGASGVGFTRIEIANNLAGVSRWQNLATLTGETLGQAANRHLLTLPTDAAPQGAFFRLAERTETAVSHLATGESPFLLSDVSYGVDEEQSWNLADTRYRIESAADLARSNNIPFTSPPVEASVPGRFTKFHFWPNILDLTEIYFLEEPLYHRIVADILEHDPARVAIAADWDERARRGERMFLARDFVSVLEAGGLRFGEVHYACVINLDAKCAQELQVHEQSELGLARLHDGLIDSLNEHFANAASLPLGEVWQMCLRGNRRRSHSQAIIVDKLSVAPAGGFFVSRLYATCQSGGGGGGPPPTTEPPPEEEPPPIPDPPRGGDGSSGQRPESKIPGAAKPPDRGDGEPPVRPWPGGEKKYDEPPPGAEGPSQGGNPGGSQQLQNEQQKIQQLLDQAKGAADQMRAKFAEDQAKFEAMGFEWRTGLKFNDPCLQAIYDRYAAQVAELQRQIAEHEATAGVSTACYKTARDSASPPVSALLSKQGLWDNMITVAGAWSNIRVPCLPPLIPSGGFVDSVFGAIIISGEATAAFHNALVIGMMNGKSWDKSVEAAIADPSRYPPSVPYGDRIFQTIWKALAKCYRDLFTAMFRVYLAK